jgi:hypothetical protein
MVIWLRGDRGGIGAALDADSLKTVTILGPSRPPFGRKTRTSSAATILKGLLKFIDLHRLFAFDL